jgi:ATP synthase mitochondrial F1 complex assembly factor 1
MFIFPVHRGEAGGFFSVLCQFQASHFLFTFLDDYRANPATAQPYMTVSAYEDMIDSKNIGLLRADVTAQLSREEGAHLVDLLRQYYSSSGSAAEFVETFNHAPAQFDFDAFMASVPLRKVTAAPAAAADSDGASSTDEAQQQKQQQRKDDA